MIPLLAGGLAAVQINDIRMGGPIQTNAQQASDLVADILPPPAYIIEAYLEATLLRQRPGDLLVRKDKLATLRKNFETRNQYWREAAIQPGIRNALTNDAYRPAAAFWAELETQFLPAIAGKDSAAIDQSYTVLTTNYLKHRMFIDTTVTQANANLASLGVEGSRQVTIAIALLVGIAVLVLALTAAAAYLILSKVVGPVSALAAVTTHLAEGGSAPVPYQGRVDELGDIAKAVEQFRQAAVARIEADARAAATQALVTTALKSAVGSLAAGDLCQEIETHFPAEYDEVRTDFNAALTGLRALIGGVMRSAEGIRTGSAEIAIASEDLASRTEGNAASLEETSAALFQIDARIKVTSVATGATVLRADQAIATVDGGRETAEEAVQAMGRVSDSAKGIDSVIEGLDKIAFQTRVLAMNAAVEAGRAGDAGRGFAVVADLVSALAMRAEEEAKRARDQLTVTQTEIGTAVEAVRKVDGALLDISTEVAGVHALLGGISTDNAAQSTAISEISAAIGAMDQSTQQNAAMVEETSAAARNLTTEVTALAEQTAMFKVDSATTGRRKPVQQVAAPASAKPKKPASASYSSPVAALAGAGADDWNAF